MLSRVTEEDLLARVTRVCSQLPEAERELTGAHAKFTVRRRTFAYFLDDHHGDGIVGVVCKAPAGMAGGVTGADPRYGGLTPAQWACFGLLAMGIYFLRIAKRGEMVVPAPAAPADEQDDADADAEPKIAPVAKAKKRRRRKVGTASP